MVQVQLVKAGFPVPDATTMTQGTPSVVLEVIDKATHVDHNYNDSVEQMSSAHSGDWESVADEKTNEPPNKVAGKEVYINDDSVEVFVASYNNHMQGDEDFISRTSAFSHHDNKDSQCDIDSNCGYKWHPQSNMLPVLYDKGFLDMDACELFTQLKPM